MFILQFVVGKILASSLELTSLGAISVILIIMGIVSTKIIAFDVYPQLKYLWLTIPFIAVGVLGLAYYIYVCFI